MEDNRFAEVKRLKKKHVAHALHWFLGEDYFSEELYGFTQVEVEQYKNLGEDAYRLFEKATERIIATDDLSYLGIPKSFHETIKWSWFNRAKAPMLMGRFDINGGLGGRRGKIIEFNADTVSSIPETILWQQAQLDRMPAGSKQFNELDDQLERKLSAIKSGIDETRPFMLGSSFGYVEDKLNIEVVLSAAHRAGYATAYCDLEEVVFSDEGIFYPIGEELQPVDIWLKLIPWDWIFNDEPELARQLSQLITENLVTVLNPPYTAVWQNKRFLAYISQYFPNDLIAETYTDESPYLRGHVRKPVYGRIGENIFLRDDSGKEEQTEGDHGGQSEVYQQYYPLPKDSDGFHYQVGLFYCQSVAALNLRGQETRIITDDCEFMSHFIKG